MMKRLIVWILVVGVALYGVYVVGANIFLNTDIGFDLINKKPEKMHIQWESGSTYLPGVVTIEGFQIRGQSKKMQWFCEMPGGTFHISLLALASKQIKIRKGRGDGFDFRSRRRLTAEEAETEIADLLPEIPGFSNPPDPAPEDIYPPRKKKKKNPWHLKINNVDLVGPVNLWLNRMQIAGTGSVGGSVDYLLGHEMEIPAAHLGLSDGRFLVDAEAIAEKLDIEIDAGFESFVLKETKGLGILEFIRAEVAIPSAVVPDLTVFGGMFPSSSGLTIESGSASLEGRLSVANNGETEGEFTLDAAGLDMASLEKRVEGDLKVITKLQKGDLVKGEFDLTGTSISLENVVASEIKKTQKEPWWGRMELLHGQISMVEPKSVSANIQLQFKDSKPLMALFGAKAIPRIDDLQGTVEMDLDSEFMVIEPMEFSGKSLVMMGKLGIGVGKPRGAIYVKYLGIPIAVNMTGEKTNLVMKKPLRWYEAQPPIRP